MTKNKISKIYLDLDGVIADFEKRYQSLYHIRPREAQTHKEFNKFFDEFIATKQFATLDFMPDTEEGLRYLDSLDIPIEILSSTASEERYDAISKQKRNWLQINSINYKQNFVPGKKHKYKFATADSVIIDDTESVINDWRKAGGIGILHKSWPETISKMRMVI
jgi:hypothetical protein